MTAITYTTELTIVKNGRTTKERYTEKGILTEIQKEYIELCSETGPRKGNFCKLRWEDIINAQITDTDKAGEQAKITIMDDRAIVEGKRTRERTKLLIGHGKRQYSKESKD